MLPPLPLLPLIPGLPLPPLLLLPPLPGGDTQSQQEVHLQPQRKARESSCLLMTSCITQSRQQMRKGAASRAALLSHFRFCRWRQGRGAGQRGEGGQSGGRRAGRCGASCWCPC